MEDVAMRTVMDFSPLYRSTVGFDRIFEMLDSATRVEPLHDSWPSYNIEKTGEGQYRITMAVAGFTPDEITLTAQPNQLLVTGKKQSDNGGAQYLHQGIAARAFKQSFDLADYVEVAGARLENGLLVIDLVRELPEAMKPRRIEIQAAGDDVKQIDQSRAA
jgi:molecular chaperone IbpA